MVQEAVQSYFKDSLFEYNQIVKDLRRNLPNQISDEIISFVDIKTREAMDNVWNSIHTRYEAVVELDKSFPKKPTKEDQQHFIKEFFRLTDPSKISADLQGALQFDKFEEDFILFMDKMTTQEYGNIFNRYIYPPELFNSLRQGILYHIDILTSSLKDFTERIGRHALVLDSVQQSQKDKAFLKGGASLLGMLVGVPFAGAGVGALMGNDESKIYDSLEKVFHGWDAYVERFRSFLGELEENYRLALMTIYGGTFIRVNEQFKAFHLTFRELNTMSGEYELELTPEEFEESVKWVKNTTNGIHNLLKYKQYKDAIQVGQNFYQVINQKPVLARTEILDGKSTLYISHLYYYLAFQEALLEEYRNGHLDSFYKTAIKLYQDLPLLIKDSDITKEFSKTSALLFRVTKEAISRGTIDDMQSILEYIQKVDKRMESFGFYIGENIQSLKEFSKEYKSFFIIENFLKDIYGLRIELDDDEEDGKLKLNRKLLKELIAIDNEIGKLDELSSYLKKQYWKTILLPWHNNSFDWIRKGKKKILAGAIGIALIFGGYTYHEEISAVGKNAYEGKEKVTSIGWSKESDAEVDVVIEQTYMQITSEYANIRSTPSLNGEIVATVSQMDKLLFLNEQHLDNEGILWNLVELVDGKQAWISSNIVVDVVE